MLTEEEINRRELDTEDGTPPLRKIYECLMIDGDYLTDGEVIDMCVTYLEAIGADDEYN